MCTATTLQMAHRSIRLFVCAVSAVGCGKVAACQFHPEKSGTVGLCVLSNFLNVALGVAPSATLPPPGPTKRLAGEFTYAERLVGRPTQHCKRVIACMDVRANDAGDLVVTKGDQYDVREKSAGGKIRNLGKPVDLAERYYLDGEWLGGVGLGAAQVGLGGIGWSYRKLQPSLWCCRRGRRPADQPAAWPDVRLCADSLRRSCEY